jgi:hypothetical protein
MGGAGADIVDCPHMRIEMTFVLGRVGAPVDRAVMDGAGIVYMSSEVL